MLSFEIRTDNLLNAQVTGTGASSAELDLRNTAGNIFLNVAARAGGTNTMSVVVEHAETSGGSFSAVPASAIWGLDGVAAAFSDVTTSATDEHRTLNRQQLRRFVRVTLTGSTLTHEVSVTAAIQPQTTEAN